VVLLLLLLLQLLSILCFMDTQPVAAILHLH
jgi:hypothetical protein